jgi:hypothetical protein
VLERLERLTGPVRGRVVDDEHLDVVTLLGQDAPDRLGEVAPRLVRRDADAHEGAAAPVCARHVITS